MTKVADISEIKLSKDEILNLFSSSNNLKFSVVGFIDQQGNLFNAVYPNINQKNNPAQFEKNSNITHEKFSTILYDALYPNDNKTDTVKKFDDYISYLMSQENNTFSYSTNKNYLLTQSLSENKNDNADSYFSIQDVLISNYGFLGVNFNTSIISSIGKSLYNKDRIEFPIPQINNKLLTTDQIDALINLSLICDIEPLFISDSIKNYLKENDLPSYPYTKYLKDSEHIVNNNINY